MTDELPRSGLTFSTLSIKQECSSIRCYEENFELRRVKVRRFRTFSPARLPRWEHRRVLTTEAGEGCTLRAYLATSALSRICL